MTRESQEIFSTLARVVRRRWPLLVIMLVATLIPVIVYNQMTPPLYEASTSLVFEEVASPVPDEVFSKTSNEQYLFNRLEEITSRSFAREIAIALPESLRTRFPRPKTQTASFDRLKYMADIIHRNMTAFPLRNSNIFKIRVQMNDRELCTAIANLSLKVLQDREYRIHRRGVVELRNFIEQQLELYGNQLRLAESGLKDFKERNNIASLDNESNEIVRRMTEAEVLYNSTHASRDATEQKLAAVQQTIARQRKELVPAVTNISSPSAQKLKEKLVDLQTQHAQLLVQNYPPNHPQMVSLQQEIDQTKKTLAEEALKVAKEGSVGDPIAQIERFMDESVTLQIEIVSLKAQENALKQTVETYRNTMGRLPEKELDLARLTRDRDVNQRIYNTLLERREEVRVAEAKQIPNSRVIDRAEVPRIPIKPRKVLNLLIGLVLGLILGTGLGFLIEGGRNELSSTIQFERETGWPILALVPRMKGDPFWKRWSRWAPEQPSAQAKRSLVAHEDPESAAGEAYLMLRTRLEMLGATGKIRTILVTSTAPGDGKSSTLSNLAVAFAAADRSTLIVDAEVRRPVIHQTFGLDKAPGLSDVLLTRNSDGSRRARRKTDREFDDASDPDATSALQTTSIANLTVMASGKRVPTGQWELSKEKMRVVLEEMKTEYDVVLVDSASPILVHDTLKLSNIIDAVIVVVDADSYDPERLAEMKRLLESAHANIVGAVLNKVDPGGAYGYYYSHYYSQVS